MATITNLGKGKKPWRVDIRKKKNGKNIYRESECFAKKSDAQIWAIRREETLSSSSNLDRAIRDQNDITVGELVALYIEKEYKLKQWGKTKMSDLKAWRDTYEEKDTLLSEIGDEFFYNFAMRRLDGGVKPQTIKSNISAVMAAFRSGRFYGHPIAVNDQRDVIAELHSRNMLAKSNKRDRRPSVDELTAMLDLIDKAKRSPHGYKQQSPIDKIILFQIFSGRRISETCRITWDDLDVEGSRVLVRDMKHPKRKKGNNVWCVLTKEALAIVLDQPKTDARIFPFNPKSVEASFMRFRDRALNRAYDETDLRLHDLRHECCSWLAEKNGLPGEHWDIFRIMMVSGHRDVKSLDRYVNMATAEPVNKWQGWKYLPKLAAS